MKKLILIIAIAFSLNAYSQSGIITHSTKYLGNEWDTVWITWDAGIQSIYSGTITVNLSTYLSLQSKNENSPMIRLTNMPYYIEVASTDTMTMLQIKALIKARIKEEILKLNNTWSATDIKL